MSEKNDMEDSAENDTEDTLEIVEEDSDEESDLEKLLFACEFGILEDVQSIILEEMPNINGRDEVCILF